MYEVYIVGGSGILNGNNTKVQKKKNVAAAIVAFVGVLYLPYVLKLEDTLAISNSIVCIPVFFGYYKLLQVMWNKENTRLYYYTGPLGVVP